MTYKNTVFYGILIVALIILLELGSALFLHIYRNLHDGRNRAVLVDQGVRDEFAELLDGSILYPTRWYTAPPAYDGRHFQTDGAGFRIDPRSVGEGPAIGFFGGSTMFSLFTDQQGTIPALSAVEGFQPLNFGMYGYSTTAELMTLAEAARLYPQMRVAVFYDGVNEVARGLEHVQTGPAPSSLFAQVGYYYDDGFQAGVANARPAHAIGYESPFLYIVAKLLEAKRVQKLGDAELDAIAARLTDVYYANAEDMAAIARSRGIVPLFYWQPTVFTTAKRLTEGEQRLASHKSLIDQLFPLVTARVLADPRRARIGLIDLSGALDGVEGDRFYDWCHVDRAGNAAVAAAMLPSLKKAAAESAAMKPGNQVSNP